MTVRRPRWGNVYSPFVRNFNFFFSAGMSQQAATVVEFDKYTWDDVAIPMGYPSSAELIQDYLEDGYDDLLSRNAEENVLTPGPVAGKPFRHQGN